MVSLLMEVVLEGQVMCLLNGNYNHMSLRNITFPTIILIIGILIGAGSAYFYFGSILPKEAMMDIRSGKFAQDRATPPNSIPKTSPSISPSVP